LCFAEIKGYKDKLIDYYVEAVDCAPTAIEKKLFRNQPDKILVLNYR